MLGIKFKFNESLQADLQQASVDFSDRVHNRIFRRAGRMAADALVTRIQHYVPYGHVPHNFIGPSQHVRNEVAFQARIYKRSGITYFAVGYRSGMNNLQTLMEKGNFLTSPRRTLHESNSGRVRVSQGAFVKKQRKQVSPGKWRYVNVRIQRKDAMRSTGSLLKKGHSLADSKSTGNFPKTLHSTGPYAPVTRALTDMRGIINIILKDAITAGLAREFKRQS